MNVSTTTKPDNERKSMRHRATAQQPTEQRENNLLLNFSPLLSKIIVPYDAKIIFSNVNYSECLYNVNAYFANRCSCVTTPLLLVVLMNRVFYFDLRDDGFMKIV